MTKVYIIPNDNHTRNIEYINEYFIKGIIPPTTSFCINFINEEGFYIRFTCKEENPVAKYKNNMDPVYEDSCVEFFANFIQLYPIAAI